MNAFQSKSLSGKIAKTFPATEAQLEIWLGSQQSVEASCSFNEMASVHFRGEFSIDAFRAAIGEIVQRNDSMRSVFTEDGQTVCVLETLDPEFGFEDWSDLDPDQTQQRHRAMVAQEGNRPFDLAQGPLIRFLLQKRSPQHHCLLINAHHILLDGWSFAVLLRDLGWFYDRETGNQREPLPPTDSYESFSQAMVQYGNSEQRERDQEFWLQEFAESIPVLELPISQSRPALKTFSADRYDHTLTAQLVQRLRKIGAQKGCSLFNTVLAAFQCYVGRITQTNDFCLGIPTSGQAAMDFPELLGMCVNTIPLRSKIDFDLPFVDYMEQSRSGLLDALEHQRFSFAALLRAVAPPRDPSRSPMVNVSFNLDPELDMSEMGFAGLELKFDAEPRCFENFEWFINCVVKNDRSIEMQTQYNTDLFSGQRMADLLKGFDKFLCDMVSNPQTPIKDLGLLSTSQQQQVIVDFNHTAMEYPDDSALHDEFSKRAKQNPEAVCVICDGRQLTYAEVDQQSNRIANYLIQQGVQPGDLVGICVSRTEFTLVLLYGILKTGAAYVPLDPDYPTDRLQYMVKQSGLKYVVSESRWKSVTAAFEPTTLAIDEVWQQINQTNDTAPGVDVAPGDVCYVIYTSGSTGNPKGVRVPHGSVVNFLYSMQKKPGLSAGDSVLAVTTLSFDIAVLELYLPSVFGGTVVMADRNVTTDGSEMAKAIANYDIKVMQATPATWRLLLSAGWQGKSDLKILCGGEPMPPDLVSPLLQRCGQLWNMYGPTETTVWSTIFQIQSAEDPILIGQPIGNTQVYILDPHQNPVPIGAEGELYIGGAGVTLGYLDLPSQTEQRFVDHRWFNPFVDYVNHRIYRTGDVAKFRNDGQIEFLRRNDKQVKVRGFRIELGEIESVLKTHPDIQQGVVIVREDAPGDTRLAAYYVPATDGEGQSALDVATIRDHLRASLPYYMIPQHFVPLKELPQTNNGKIDHKSLPIPQQMAESKTADSLPLNSSEQLVVGVWRQVLDVEEVTLHDNFFDLGGHSLLVMEAIRSIEQRSGVKLSPRDFLIGTVSQIAEQIPLDVKAEQTTGDASPPLPAAEDSEPPTSFPDTGPLPNHASDMSDFWN